MTNIGKYGVLSSLRERLIYGGIWALSGRAVTIIIAFIVNIILARLLNPDDLGAYFITFSIVSVATVLAQMGLNQVVVRLISESIGNNETENIRGIIRVIFYSSGIGAAVIAAILILGGGQLLAMNLFNSPIISNVIGMVAVWVILSTFQGMLGETFRGFHDIKSAVLYGGLLPSILTIMAIICLWIIKGSSELPEIIIAIVLASTVNLLFSGYALRKKIKNFVYRRAMHASNVLRIGMPMLMTSLSFTVLTQADLWVLGVYRTNDEVAIYGAVIKLIALVALPLQIINAVVPPIISGMFIQGHRNDLERTLRVTATLAAIPAMLFLIVLFIFGGPILGFMYGNYYMQGASIIIFLCIGQFINVISGSCGLLLNMTGHHIHALVITLVSAVISIILSVTLVTDYGMYGVAIANTVGLVLQNIGLVLYSYKLTGIKSFVTFQLNRKSLY